MGRPRRAHVVVRAGELLGVPSMLLARLRSQAGVTGKQGVGYGRKSKAAAEGGGRDGSRPRASALRLESLLWLASSGGALAPVFAIAASARARSCLCRLGAPPVYRTSAGALFRVWN